MMTWGAHSQRKNGGGFLTCTLHGRIGANPGQARSAASWCPIGPDEVWPAEAVVIMRVDHRPRQVTRADEEIGVAEGPERNQGAATLIPRDCLETHIHGQSGNLGREWDDQIVIAHLALILKLGLQLVPKPGPTLESLAIHPPPSGLNLNPLRIGQPHPRDTRSTQLVPQGFIERLGEGESSSMAE